MGLQLKFNLALLVVFVSGLAGSGYVSYNLLQKNAYEDVLNSAGVIMEAALAMRFYTVNNVRPNLAVKLDTVLAESGVPATEAASGVPVFLPESVPAFAATQVMERLRKKYPDYVYKEAALNPTNLRDKAVEWEADVINEFRNNPDKHTEISGIRDTPTGPALYLARPLQIKDPACLRCHTTPDMAPPGMIKIYGTSNGFGWQLNEVIGVQLVSVPMTLPIKNAQRAFYTFMASLGGIFLAVFVFLNILLSVFVIRPITKMAKAADEISTGNMEVAEFSETGANEVKMLSKSFNRMRRSLEKAISLIDKN